MHLRGIIDYFYFSALAYKTRQHIVARPYDVKDVAKWIQTERLCGEKRFSDTLQLPAGIFLFSHFFAVRGTLY